MSTSQPVVGSNNSTDVLALQSNHVGVSFVLILDGCIFLLGLILMFCCLRNLRLWKKKKHLVESSSPPSTPSIQNKELVFIRFLKRIYSWIVLEGEYERIGKLYGQEVGVYLWFSHQLILFFGLATVLGLSILIPLNVLGKSEEAKTDENPEKSTFLYMTSVNFVRNDYLYAHVVLFYAFSGVIFFLLHRFTSSKFVTQYIRLDGVDGSYNSNVDTDQSTSQPATATATHTTYSMISNYSVLVKDLPVDCLDNTKLRNAIESIFPNLRIYSCRIMHDTSERVQLEESLQESIEQIAHYDYVKNQTGKQVMLIKLFEGEQKDKCCGGKLIERVDALDYWTSKKEKLEQLISDWEHGFEMVPKSTGYAHVIFKSIHDASECKAQSMNGLKLFKSRELDFKIERAHEPQDVNWRNFGFTSKQRNIRSALVNFFVFILLVFFTSPLAVVSAIQSIASRIPEAAEAFNQIRSASGYTGDLLFHYLPTLLLFLFSQVIPMSIPMLTKIEKHLFYSQESRVYLLRLFIYLLLSTLVLPVLLLTSLDGVIRYFEGSEDWKAALDRLFLPQSGAFFLNYVIQYTLLGGFVDIIRLRDLVMYLYLRFKSVTEEEKEKAATISEFDLPMEYGYLISFFGIIFTFSVFTPLVLPVGFFYFLMKHIIDRYNIQRLCSKNDKARYKLSPDISSYRGRNKLIVQLAFTCILLAQIYITLYFAKSGERTYIQLLLMAMLNIGSLIYCLYWTMTYKTNFEPSEMSSSHIRLDTTAVHDEALLTSTFYSDEEELSLFSNQLERFSVAYFPPFALDSISGLREQKDEEMKQHLDELNH